MSGLRERFGRRRARKEEANDEPTESLVAIQNPASASTEAYRGLRTNLLYALVDAPSKTIVLTSSGSGEGKSTSCGNLGVVLAQAEKSVLLVDCDLRKPAIHRLFGLRNMRGVVDVLAREHSLKEVWHEPLPGLKVVTTGLVPPNPAELLGSRRFAEFLGEASRDFDYVLVDAPPVRAVADPVVLATMSDAVLLVVDARGTRKVLLQQAVRRLEAVGANVVGTIMNNAKTRSQEYYYGGYE